MGLGAGISAAVRDEPDPQVLKLKVNISGCPNACGQHWTGDIGFYGNARKIDGQEVPYYLMLLGGTSTNLELPFSAPCETRSGRAGARC